MARDAVPLSYTNPPPWYRTRLGRWSAAFMIAAALALAGMLFGPGVVRCAGMLSLQRQLLAWTPVDASRPVLTHDPVHTTNTTPDAWRELYGRLSQSGLKSDGTLFVGRLTPRDSDIARVVIVDALRMPGLGDAQVIWAVPRVLLPGNALRDPVLLPGNNELEYVAGSAGPLAVYAGQPDPADASHFTLRVSEGDATHTLDGYLRRDNTVTLQRRPALATDRHTTSP